MRRIAVGWLWVWVATAPAAEVRSANGDVRFTVSADGGQLQYRVELRGKVVIENSPVNFSVDGVELTRGIKLGKPEAYEINEKYPWRGVHSTAVNHCRGVKIPVSGGPPKGGTPNGKSDYVFEARVFNDGAAFRLIIPGKKDSSRVPDESTSFIVPEGSTLWYHDLGGHYEAVYQRKAIGEVEPGQWAAPPVTFEVGAKEADRPKAELQTRVFASITEAALINYAGMALQADGKRGFNLVLGHKHPISYPYRLRYSNDIERVSMPAAVTGEIVTPWRVIMVAKDLNALVNSDIVHNLSPVADPKLFPKGFSTDWIKPGRAVWKYLDGGANTFEEMKNFCERSGELGFEHHVIEGFWRRWSDEQLKELVAFGKERGVGIWLWRHSRELRESESRRAFFQKCRDAGVVGVKLDFFDHEAKEIIDFYQTLLRETAEHKLMVNFHGANKPTGEARMWPNELIREGVRGMESSRLKERARHNTTLPFTRFLAGHADYTPVHFGARRGDTTWAHQIATAAVFTEPLLTYGAHPTNLLQNPAVEMIKSIPAVWDETIVLPGSAIGEIAAFARRHGKTWFLAILNGPEQRTFKAPLSFLGRGSYAAEIVRDDPGESAAVQIERNKFNAKEALEVDLAAGGGYIARLSLQENANGVGATR
jgi:alpha-glucosidase